ncbi:MAG: hypothetical protein ACE366_08535 [Bradymonadia bacterium]
MGLIDIDATFFIQLGLFLALLMIMRGLVFKPFLEADARRTEKTEKTRQEARVLDARASELSSRYDEEYGAARTQASSARAALRGEGLDAKEAAIAKATAETTAHLDEVRAGIKADVESARQSMLGQVDDLAKQVAEKIIGRPV